MANAKVAKEKQRMNGLCNGRTSPEATNGHKECCIDDYEILKTVGK